VVEEALKKAGLTFREGYDDIVTCSSDHWEGLTLTDIRHGEVAGAHLGPGEEKVCHDGANAVLFGCVKILSGHARVVVVTSACKENEVLNPSVIENFGFDAPYQQLLGLDFTQAGALQATCYMDRCGLAREDFARAAVKSRRAARDNPFLQGGGEAGVEEVMASQMLAYPITAMERKPACDGACAMVLACEERAGALTDRPVWIVGIGNCCDFHNLGDRDLAESRSLENAARQAYQMAGIRNPAAEIGVFEIGAHYSYQSLMWIEGLGLCGKGEAAGLLRDGHLERNGRMPVDPSGGLLGGVPRYVAGSNSVIEAANQLCGEAGEVAVEGRPRYALAHGTSGPAGQHHCVIVMKEGE
jgi:acetyl-CoA C-acetyltransferase